MRRSLEIGRESTQRTVKVDVGNGEKNGVPVVTSACNVGEGSCVVVKS